MSVTCSRPAEAPAQGCWRGQMASACQKGRVLTGLLGTDSSARVKDGGSREILLPLRLSGSGPQGRGCECCAPAQAGAGARGGASAWGETRSSRTFVASALSALPETCVLSDVRTESLGTGMVRACGEKKRLRLVGALSPGPSLAPQKAGQAEAQGTETRAA